MDRTKKEKTISGQIQSGYLILTGIIIALVLLSMLCLSLTESYYTKIVDFEKQQYASQQVVTAHYKWLEQLGDSITTGAEFKGSLDPNTCALGKWLNSSSEDLKNYPEIAKYIKEIETPHREIHSQATELIALSATNKNTAYQQYTSVFKPKVAVIDEGLTKAIGSYQSMSDRLLAQSKTINVFSNILMVIMGCMAVVISVIIGRRMAAQISQPIQNVEKWSEQLSTGVDNLNIDMHQVSQGQEAKEIHAMIQSFHEMAESIKQNVSVIKQVADGDLTVSAFVRSEGDSLGRSLNQLVDNNNQIFAQLLEIAESVTTNASQIADTSQSLANSSTVQASAVENLSATVHSANNLASDNADNARDVAALVREMNSIIEIGQEKMSNLLKAVHRIESASSQVSVVMKSVNDIAFQTNILALNAAVEAARAGSAGRGFAVVAEEVRNLAIKSQEAAEQSRGLIENTISMASEGADISSQASDTFQAIVDRIKQVEGTILHIDQASNDQQNLIQQITEEINAISGAVTQNAASSEENAASTQQLYSSSNQIRDAIKRFRLKEMENKNVSGW